MANPALLPVLRSLGSVLHPSMPQTPVLPLLQAESYPLLLSGAPAVALADQAGSGKTLAYLLPLLQQLKAAEAAAGGRVSQPGSPSIIILTPTVGECVGRGRSCVGGAAGRVRTRCTSPPESQDPCGWGDTHSTDVNQLLALAIGINTCRCCCTRRAGGPGAARAACAVGRRAPLPQRDRHGGPGGGERPCQGLAHPGGWVGGGGGWLGGLVCRWEWRVGW